MRSLTLRPAAQKKGMHFMLIPLIDVIFLLITFFMLSSNLAAYSALSLGDYRRESEASAPASRNGRHRTARSAAHRLVRRGARQRYADAAGSLRRRGGAAEGAGAQRAVVFVRPSATTQDIVTVLEVLKRTAFATVSVRTRQAG